jgi:uncharacterized protein YndB with AHSA1/START domain
MTLPFLAHPAPNVNQSSTDPSIGMQRGLPPASLMDRYAWTKRSAHDDERAGGRIPGVTAPELPRADVEADLAASTSDIYRVWTQDFDAWFATPGTLMMRAEVGAPFYFDVEYDGKHHPHYGRFLALDPDRLVELTWVTGAGGTEGAETVVRIELTATDTGTHLVLAHTGFYTEESVEAARQAWPHVLRHLDSALAST